VPLDQWHPELGDTGTGLRSTAYGGVGRKPAPAG
jgi:hypothetical protein